MTRLFSLGAALIAGVLLLHTAPAVAKKPALPEVGINELQAGSGDAVTRHAVVRVHYTGWLTDGTKFDSSHDRGEPIQFTLGAGQVIVGWDVGLEGMKVGGKRELTIPPQLGYGAKGAGDAIPPNATLKFEVELVSFVPPKYNNIGNAELQEMLDRGVKIVDVRRAEEWAKTGIVDGSKKLTAFDKNSRFVRSFPAEFQEFVGPDEEIILICRTGNRSSVIAQMLTEQAGYTKVYNVTDGIVKWIGDKKPVVK